jgi:type I restriction enzyme S subunit
MIDDLKPYFSLKDSGLPWLGEIPAHWEAARLKRVFREIDHRSGAGKEPLLSLRMQGGLVDHHASGGKPIPPDNLVN